MEYKQKNTYSHFCELSSKPVDYPQLVVSSWNVYFVRYWQVFFFSFRVRMNWIVCIWSARDVFVTGPYYFWRVQFSVLHRCFTGSWQQWPCRDSFVCCWRRIFSAECASENFATCYSICATEVIMARHQFNFRPVNFPPQNVSTLNDWESNYPLGEKYSWNPD